MIPAIRKHYNETFTTERYKNMVNELSERYSGSLDFRVAETPIFASKALGQKLVKACEDIVDIVLQPDFKELTRHAIPPHLHVANEDDHCDLMCMDFAVCRGADGELAPQLIEMQGFPTLMYYQTALPRAYRRFFDIPQGFSNYLDGFDYRRYHQLLKNVLLNGYDQEHVVLLEVKPDEQKTRIDFHVTEEATGIQAVCITELIQEGKHLFYLRDGVKTPIRRIYNRIIFDDLESQREALGDFVDITQDLDVEWVPHPNWFYRISKYTLPFINSPYVPETRFLDQLENVPADLENYVLKPLFSFAGQGVIIDVKPEDIKAIANPKDWIIQRKINYEPVLETPSGPAKCEIRMIYIWERGTPRPVPANNLARISKGKMIGVRYNQNLDWVGGSVVFFERD